MSKKLAVIMIAIATVATVGAAEEHGSGSCSERVLATLHRIATTEVYEVAGTGCTALDNGQGDVGLGLLEEGMRRALPNPAVFGVLQSIYWPEIQWTHQALRAAGFFRGLELAHPDDPEVLAAAGNAVGMALPELRASGAPSSLVSRWAALATADFAKALEIDPDNFSARLGRAIFTSFIPGRFDDSDRQFRDLIALRARYRKRQYPWGVVYVQWARAASRNGNTRRAREILEEGRSALPGDPVLAHAGIH